MNSVKQKYGRTFPLHLPPIDWFFLCDDTPEYPMVFYVELELSGDIVRSHLEAALQEALERHPLLFSTIQPAKQNQPCWVPVPEQMPTIQWSDGDAPLELGGREFIDIRNEVGLRVFVRQSGDRTKITMHFHHATCDGTGAYRFIGDWIACYMKRMPSCADKVQLGVFDAAQLKNRRAKMRSIKFDDRPMHKLRLALVEGWKQFFTRVQPLRTPANKPSTRVAPGIVNKEMTADQPAALRQSAITRGATVNDLLLCKMFQTAKQWNGKVGRRRLRILVPSDTRDGDDFEIPASNMTAYTFISVPSADLDNEDALLEHIRTETLEIKNGNMQKSFVDGLSTAMTVPPVLPMILRRNVSLATSVLSNAGDPSRRFTCKVPRKRGKIVCDEFALESISGVPPLRRKTHCTLSSSSYGRRLMFSMRCNPHFFSVDDTRQLLDMYCDQLRPLTEPSGS